MTQTRPRIDDNLAAEVQAYADAYHVSFNAAVKILLILGLKHEQADTITRSTP